jgi:hypothetical protein
MFKVVGYDRAGVPRTYGLGQDEYEAHAECQLAIIAYVRRRPDTGPVSSWGKELVET